VAEAPKKKGNALKEKLLARKKQVEEEKKAADERLASYTPQIEQAEAEMAKIAQAVSKRQLTSTHTSGCCGCRARLSWRRPFRCGVTGWDGGGGEEAYACLEGRGSVVRGDHGGGDVRAGGGGAAGTGAGGEG
jgi:hypothetical protein